MVNTEPMLLVSVLLLSALWGPVTRGFCPSSTSYVRVALYKTRSTPLVHYPLLQATKLPKEIEKPDAASITEIKEEDDISSRGNDAFVIDNVESIIVESPEKIRHHTRTLFGNIISSNSLDVSKDPVVNEMRMMREVVNSCPELWAYMNALCPDRKAIFDEHLCDNIVDLSYHLTYDAVRRSAAAFDSLGITKGDHVAVFAENSAHWLFADQGIQLVGGATVVRGADAPIEELRYIYDNSDANEVVVLQGPTLLKKLEKAAEDNGMEGIGLNSKHGPAKTVVLMHREGIDDDQIAKISLKIGLRIVCLADVLNRAAPIATLKVPKVSRDDLATIVYTSGTTGRPKGVMLTHGNLLHQIQLRFAPSKKYDVSEPMPGDVMVTILPVWHITERAAELCMFSRGCTLVYSNVKNLKSDLSKHKPHWMMLVPRVLEKVALGVQDKFSKKSKLARIMIHFFTLIASAKSRHSKIAKGYVVAHKKPNLFRRLFSQGVAFVLTPIDALGRLLVWNKVKDALGGRQKLIMSGGSALSGSIEDFYETCGILLVVGYGLTECSPMICHRRTDSNLIAGGCVGMPVTNTEVMVVDIDADIGETERKALEHGKTGLVLARGPQVMKGYYNNQKATEKSIDSFGWFDTGDLGYINPATGDLFICGRAKDTIVLSNGENVEPNPIEDTLIGCKLIDQVLVTGQDEKQLTAVVVLSPQELASEGFLEKEEGDRLQNMADNINDPHCSKTDYAEASQELNKACEKIRSNKELVSYLNDDAKRLLKNFRKWEQVGHFTIVLEPFAMVNKLLTQSYKIKRGPVIERYVKK